MKNQRIILRHLKDSDFPYFYKYFFKDEEVLKYMGWELIYEEDKALELFSYWRKAKNNQYRFAITLKEDDTPIGYIDVYRMVEDFPEIGFALFKKYWHQGYMSEAVNLMVDILFNEGFNTVQMGAVKENLGSNNVAKRNDFIFIKEDKEALKSSDPNEYETCYYRRYKYSYHLLAATNNEHKLEEIKAILAPHGIKVYSLKELNIDIEVEENGKTYKENALLKVNALKDLTTYPIISDDSGIEISALNNMPGIHTARYAKEVGGYYNAFKIILEACKQNDDYKATFNCDIAFIDEDRNTHIFEGRIKGSIAKDITGEHGFGFDPIFISDETGVTNASLSPEEKNRFSARAAALNKLINYLILKGYAR